MNTLPNTTEETVFTLLRRHDLRASRRQWIEVGVLTLIAWLGTTAFFGRYRPNEIARAIEAAIPGDAFVVMLAAAATLAALGAALRRTQFAACAAIVAGFLAGNLLYSWLYAFSGLRFPIPLTQFSDALHFAAARLLWALNVLLTTVPFGSPPSGASTARFRA